MTALADATPYVNTTENEVYFKASETRYPQVQGLAAAHARDTIGDWGRADYIGRGTYEFHNCGEEELYADDEDWDEHTKSYPGCLREPGFKFRMYEYGG